MRNTCVMIIGCGGLGSTVSTVLSRSGVGRLILADHDTVALHNLHRQFLYTLADLERPKADCAVVAPQLCLSENVAVKDRLDAAEIMALIDNHHPAVVVDCTDNFPARYAINTACASRSIPWVHASVTGLNAQVAVFCAGSACPCYECVHPDSPRQGLPPPVAPVIVSLAGTLEAEQVIALITGVGEVLRGSLLTVDLGRLSMRTFRLRGRRPDCGACGTRLRQTSTTPSAATELGG